MDKTKRLLKYSLCIIVVGLILVVAGFSMGAKFGIIRESSGYRIYNSEDKVIKNEEIAPFKSIEINASFDNIDIIKSDKYAIELEYSKAQNNIDYIVSEDGKLVIKEEMEESMKVSIGYTYSPSYIKVYVPSDINLETIAIKSSNTDLTINNIIANEFLIDCKYGTLNISDLQGEKIDINTNNNKVVMENIITKSLLVKNDYGNINAENINTDNFDIYMNNGDIKINNLKAKSNTIFKNKYGSVEIKNSEFNILNNSMDNGKLDIENVTVVDSNIDNKYGGINLYNFISNDLKIEASNSDIKVDGELKGNTNIISKYGDIKVKTNLSKDLYNYGISCDYGDIKIDGDNFEENIENNSNQENSINVDSNNGDITIDFK